MSFPVASADRRADAWERFSQRRDGRASWSVQEGRFFLGLSFMPEASPHQWWGKVEWNPSKVVDSEGWSVATVEEAELTVEGAVAAVTKMMEPAEESPEWRVRRLDVTRDFETDESPGEVIRALAAVHRPWSRKNLLHSDVKRNGAQTLMVGSKAGVTRLYDKHAETHGAAPEGTVRWETEARSDWCQRYGDIARLGDVSCESVEVLAMDRFEWSGMGAEVASSVSHLVYRINTCPQLATERERAGFGWFLVQQAAGVLPELSPTTLAKYRRLQRELGIVGADLSRCVEVVRRLDWDSGKEVLRVA